MEKETKLNKRQQLILKYIEENVSVQTNQILDYLVSEDFDITRMTIVRDLNNLVTSGFLSVSGAGRNVSYSLILGYKLLKHYNIDEYFKTQGLLRDVQESFNNDIFKYFNKIKIFSDKEFSFLEKLHTKYKTKISKFDDSNKVLMKREFERLIIDLAWKSSQIEGNTYTLFETEALLKNKVKASGRTELEAVMILNHKKAVDFIVKEQDYFKHITLKKIEELHSVLIEDMGVQCGLRSGPVGITGTKYKPLFNNADIKDAMNEYIKVLNTLVNPFVKALSVIALIAYIQPFQDGNKRTARLLANSVLYSHGYSMLSYSSADVVEYKKAIVLFYEQNSIQYLKQIFMEQYKFAVDNYY